MRLAAAVTLSLTLLASELRASESASADWRATAEFDEVDGAISRWLEESSSAAGDALARWRVAVEDAQRADGLGAVLRQLALEVDGRFASVLSEPAESPPDWLVDHGDAQPSIRLAVAEHLASTQRFDACLAWTEGLADQAVYSPELLVYLRAIAGHVLVEDEVAAAGLAELEPLLSTANTSPLGAARTWLARRLIEQAKERQEPDPLATVARRMADAERRLAQTEASEPTQTQQRKAIEALDELIEKLEEQRKQQQMQQQAAGGAGGGAESGRPAEESRPGELKGPGEVDRKRLVAGDDWGSLPPAERARLTQAMTRDFPPHYRQLVEDYFRTLAAEADQAKPSPSEP